MLDVIGFGENSLDVICRVAALPGAASGKLPILSRSVRAGGQVATTLAACAALGLRTGYAGAFGNDEAARTVQEELVRRGVNLSRASVRDAPNRQAIILVDAQGERLVLGYRDARLRIRPEDVRSEWVADVRVVHVDAVDEAASIALARLARRAGIPVTSDIDEVTAYTLELLAAVSIPIFAESVPSILTGEADVETALRTLRRTHGGWLVVTLGARGAMLLDGDRLHHEPAFGVQAVDTTGAGDMFRAGFIRAYLDGRRGRDLLQFANAAAAVSCTREGAMDSIPTFDEVSRLVATAAARE